MFHLNFFALLKCCTNYNFQGNCTLREQLPTLKLLVDFMKCMFIERSNAERPSREAVEEIVKVLERMFQL